MAKKKKAFKREKRFRPDLNIEYITKEFDTDWIVKRISPDSELANVLFHENNPYEKIAISGDCSYNIIEAGIDAIRPAEPNANCIYKLYRFELSTDELGNIFCRYPGVPYDEHHRDDIPDYFFEED